MSLYLFAPFLFFIFAFCGYRRTTALNDNNEHFNKALIVLLFLIALFIRLFSAAQNLYFETDMHNFQAWGLYAHQIGFKNLYSSEIFIDYPPGYIYILRLMYLICSMLGININSTAAAFVFKMPAVISDFAIAVLIYRFSLKTKLSKPLALFSALFFLFLPCTIFNSSVWGQIESFYILFILLSFCCAYQDKTIPAAVFFAAALITKPQSLMFGFILLFYILRRKSIAEFFKAVLTGFISLWAFSVPFSQNILNPFWIIKLYANTITGYKYFTVNAFNSYFLAKLNWVQLPQGCFSLIINIAVIAISLSLALYILAKNRKYNGFFAAQAVIITLIFSFCTMMHERYLWPAAVLCLFAFIVSRNKFYLAFAAVFDFLCFINSYCALSMYSGGNVPNIKIQYIFSFLTVTASVVFSVYTIYITVKNKNYEKI